MTTAAIQTAFLQPAAEKASAAECRDTRHGPLHFRLGVIPLSVQSVYAPALREFQAMYRERETAEAAHDAIQISVVHARNRGFSRRRFEIFGDGEKRFDVWSRRAVLPHIECAINWQIMLYWPGLYQIHAGVVARDGAGVIFPASPGSGKSTLTTGLVSKGWRYLSDEFALIDPETLRLRAYPKAICLKEGSFSVLDSLGLGAHGRRKYVRGSKGRVTFIAPREFDPASVTDDVSLKHIVFVRYAEGERPALRRISRAEAVIRLTEQSFNFLKFRSRGVELLARVVRSADCFELVSGEIHATCDVLSRELFGH